MMIRFQCGHQEQPIDRSGLMQVFAGMECCFEFGSGIRGSHHTEGKVLEEAVMRVSVRVAIE